MKVNTSEAILQFVGEHGRAKPIELVRSLQVSNVLIHRHLKRLVGVGKLNRVGAVPKVYYVLKENLQVNDLKIQEDLFLDENYLYVSPQGELIKGLSGFSEWVRKTRQDKYLVNLLEEYKKVRTNANNFVSKEGFIDGTEKIKGAFLEMFLDHVYFKDFYSIEKFGKTRLGQLVMLAKSSGDLRLLEQIADLCKPVIEKIIEMYSVEAVAFVPHSVPRVVQFNTELERRLQLKLFKIQLEKAYVGIPIQQKSLSKLEDRVENASKTIFLGQVGDKFDTVLLIDDAVGSGATMNETARKLKETGNASRVIGFAVVGSMKGFEVISVV